MTFRRLTILCVVLAGPCQAQFSGKLIMLDAGHGGTDPGALGIDGAGYPNEEDMVLDIVLRLQARLEAAGASVMLVRQTDTTVSLTARRDMANSLSPDLFLSIHANSFTDAAAAGTETFWASSGTADDQQLAQAVQTRMVQAFSRTDRGVKQANFTVLTANPPSALAELMFISNQAEFDILKTSPNRELAASALYQACADFLVVDLTEPVFTLQPQSRSVAEGSTASFSATTATGAGLAWRWQRGGVDLTDDGRISGSGTPTLTIRSCGFADAGFYTARVTGPNLPGTTREAQLVINTPARPPGTGRGLRGSYYKERVAFGLHAVRQDATVDFDWEDGPPFPGMARDAFSVRWTGQLEPRYTQEYRLHVRTADPFRLWLDGSMILSQNGSPTPVEVSQLIRLTSGLQPRIVLEHLEDDRDASIQLSWSSASQIKEIIPSSQLHRPVPELSAPPETWMVEGGSALIPVAATSPDPVLSVQVLTDFSIHAAGTSDRVLFRKPNFTSTTLAFVDPGFPDSALISAAVVGGGVPTATACLAVEWKVPAAAVNPWLRLTTSNAMFLGNPVIDFRQQLRFDVRTAQPIRIGLGLRETNGTQGIGADGGRTGTVEYVGVSAATARPEPVRTVLPAPQGTWHTLEFDIPREPVRAYTGDGILTSTSGKGVLEHLCIVPESSGSEQSVLLDNFAIVEPNRLTWSLAVPVPGASIHPATGLITWQPGAGTGGSAVALTAVATDSGTPPQTATRTIQLRAVPPPVVLAATVQDGQFSFSWTSADGAKYRVEASGDPAAAWENLGEVTAGGAVASWIRPALPGRRFYRARWIP